MSYHQRALALLHHMALPSVGVAQTLDHLAAVHGISLPQAVREWLCLDPDAHLFHMMTHFPHAFVSLHDLPNHVARHRFSTREVLAVDIIFENQGCFVMAVSLEDGDNPPVWVSEDFNFCGDAPPTWALQSHSFRDCIEAFAWDFDVCGTPDYEERFLSAESIPERAWQPMDGPTTFAASAWFRCREFRRMVHNGRRVTVLIE
jgi:hypothetical protein